MNRVEAAACRVVPDNTSQLRPFMVNAAEVPVGYPVAGTPAAFFGAFAVAYVVAMAFGGYVEASDAALADLMAEGVSVDDLVALREGAASS